MQYLHDIQDQTVNATEVRDLQAEVQRLRDDNSDLRKRNGELTKVGTKVEQLESKVRLTPSTASLDQHLIIDGRDDQRTGHAEGERAARDIR